MSTALARRESSTIVSSSGGVSLIRGGTAMFKAGSLVAIGYAAAEIGGGLLRSGISQVDTFAAGGKVQEAVVKLAPGLLVSLMLTWLTYRASSRGGGSSMQAATSASKVFLLTMIGVGASMVRKPVSDFVEDVGTTVRGALGMGGATSASTADVIDMNKKAGGDGASYWTSTGNKPKGPYPGMAKDADDAIRARAGGDAGSDRPTSFDPTKVGDNESF